MMQIIGFILLTAAALLMVRWVHGPNTSFKNPLLYCYWLCHASGLAILGLQWGGPAVIMTVMAILVGAYLNDRSERKQQAANGSAAIE